MDKKVSMVFNRKSGSIKEMARDRHIVNRHHGNYHMTYLFMPFPMTLDDLEGLMQDLSNATRRTFVRHLARS